MAMTMTIKRDLLRHHNGSDISKVIFKQMTLLEK